MRLRSHEDTRVPDPRCQEPPEVRPLGSDRSVAVPSLGAQRLGIEDDDAVANRLYQAVGV